MNNNIFKDDPHFQTIDNAMQACWAKIYREPAMARPKYVFDRLQEGVITSASKADEMLRLQIHRKHYRRLQM